MKNPTLDQLKKNLIASLNNKYGYCGCADTPAKAILNSGGDDEDFRITIEDCSEVAGGGGESDAESGGKSPNADLSQSRKEYHE